MAGRTQVLVTYASKMGSTQEIAEAIGRELEAFGMQVAVAPCADNVNPDGFDEVTTGSAIYTRRWVKTATKYLKRHAHRLDRHKTWLFHSGPCGEGAREEQVQAPVVTEEEDLLLVLEVVVEAALGHPERVGDLLDAGSVVAAAPEGRGRALQDLGAPLVTA